MSYAPLLLRRWSLLLLFIFHLEKLLNLQALMLENTNAFPFEAIVALFVLFQLSLLLALVKTRRRFVWLALALCAMSSDFTSFSHDGADVFAFHLLLAAAVFPVRTPKIQDFCFLLGLILVQGQLVIIYLYNFSAKLADPLWRSGDALAYFLSGTGVFSSALNFSGAEIVCRILTWSVMLVQLGVVFELPLATRKMASGLLMLIHLSIAAFLHPYFGLICATLHAYVFFCPTPLGDSLRFHFQRAKPGE